MEDKLLTLKKWIESSRRIVFFGGAGVSTESGVPDFRSKDGLYNQHDVRFDGYQPEYLLSRDCLDNEPEVFFEFYRQKMDTRNVLPNEAHKYLARLEREGKLKAVVTQNIDGLHQKAGSVNVCEIHGTTLRNYCMKCGREYPSDFIFESAARVPRCACGGVVRCGVTLYGEALPSEAFQNAADAVHTADMMIIGGTSLTVYPAAGLVDLFEGEHMVIINKEHIPYPLRCGAVLEINLPIWQVFEAISQC